MGIYGLTDDEFESIVEWARLPRVKNDDWVGRTYRSNYDAYCEIDDAFRDMLQCVENIKTQFRSHFKKEQFGFYLYVRVGSFVFERKAPFSKSAFIANFFDWGISVTLHMDPNEPWVGEFQKKLKIAFEKYTEFERELRYF